MSEQITRKHQEMSFIYESGAHCLQINPAEQAEQASALVSNHLIDVSCTSLFFVNILTPIIASEPMIELCCHHQPEDSVE